MFVVEPLIVNNVQLEPFGMELAVRTRSLHQLPLQEILQPLQVQFHISKVLRDCIQVKM